MGSNSPTDEPTDQPSTALKVVAEKRILFAPPAVDLDQDMIYKMVAVLKIPKMVLYRVIRKDRIPRHPVVQLLDLLALCLYDLRAIAIPDVKKAIGRFEDSSTP